MSALLLIVGLGLLAGAQPPVLPDAAPRGPAVPDPLPQLQAPGLPPAPELPPAAEKPAPGADVLKPNPTSPPALVPLKKVTPAPAAPPARLPAFRRVAPEPQPERPAPRPQIPETAPAVPAPPAGVPGALTPTVAVDKIGPKAVQAGEPFRYEIVLRNVGTVPAERVLLEDELPPGTRVLAAQPTPLAQAGHLAWQIEGLAPGEEKRFTVDVQAAHGGEWKGTALVMVGAHRTFETAVSGPAAPPAPAPAAPAPPPEGRVDLDLRGPVQAVLGHPLAFELRVTNRSTFPLANLILRTVLPPGLEHCYGPEMELNLDPLAPGESRTETLEVIAAQPGRHTLAVNVQAGGIQSTTARADVLVREDPVLAVRLVGPRQAATDREQAYQIEVTNRSGGPLRDVVLLDRLPQGVALVGGVTGGSFDKATRTVRWALGNLAAGQVRTVAFKVHTRAAGPALNDIVVRTGQGQQARLRTVLKFYPQRTAAGR